MTTQSANEYLCSPSLLAMWRIMETFANSAEIDGGGEKSSDVNAMQCWKSIRIIWHPYFFMFWDFSGERGKNSCISRAHHIVCKIAYRHKSFPYWRALHARSVDRSLPFTNPLREQFSLGKAYVQDRIKAGSNLNKAGKICIFVSLPQNPSTTNNLNRVLRRRSIVKLLFSLLAYLNGTSGKLKKEKRACHWTTLINMQPPHHIHAWYTKPSRIQARSGSPLPRTYAHIPMSQK